jgi:DNA primase
LDHFTDPVLADIGKGIIDQPDLSGGDVAELVSRWDDPHKKAVIARLSLSDEIWGQDGCLNLINQFEASVRRRDKTLLARIDAAEKSGDQELVNRLLLEKQQQARKTMVRPGGADR